MADVVRVVSAFPALERSDEPRLRARRRALPWPRSRAPALLARRRRPGTPQEPAAIAPLRGWSSLGQGAEHVDRAHPVVRPDGRERGDQRVAPDARLHLL